MFTIRFVVKAQDFDVNIYFYLIFIIKKIMWVFILCSYKYIEFSKNILLKKINRK